MNRENRNTSFNFKVFEKEAIARLRSGEPLTGKEGVITPLIKRILEGALQGELSHHLKEEAPVELRNRRNGVMKKQMKTGTDRFELETPRDRLGTFEPELIKKRQTTLNESLDQKILSLYGLGMSYEAIQDHLKELYGLELSTGKISMITDRLLPIIAEWQSRPLESVYPVVFLDAIFFKTREEGRVVTKAVYSVLGINQAGRKDVLGFYCAESEGARFWLNVLNDLKTRGVEDILVACVDGLKGFPDSIRTVFPKTDVQLCIVHQIRHSLKYIVHQDQKPFLRELKKIYQAPSLSVAEQQLQVLETSFWGQKYPYVLQAWKNNWEALSRYFNYPAELRRVIYTTNAVEGLHRQLRRVTKTKGAFSSENALLKLLYCALQKIQAKWTQPIPRWALVLSQLHLLFEDRLQWDYNRSLG
jgi:putative transposase